MNSVVTVEQTTIINALLNKVFTALSSLAYTVMDITITFLSQPAILGTIAGLIVIGGLYWQIKRKARVA